MADQNKSSLQVIFFTVFMYLVGFGVIIPLLPVLSLEMGATPFEVGIFLSVYSFVQFLFSPWWGRLSDRYGRRRILLFCLGGEIFAYSIFALARSVEGILFARALSGFFGASLSTASAAISDITPPKERSRGMALIGAAFGLGFIFGPALGGGLSVWGQSISSEKYFATSFTLWGVAILCALNFVFAYFFLKETNTKLNTQEKRGGRFRALYSELRKPTVGGLIWVFFLSSFAIACMESTLALYVFEKFKWGLKEVSFGFAYIGVIATLNQGFLVRRLLPLWGERKTLYVGLSATAAGLAMIGLSSEVWILGLAMTVFSFGYAFINPSVLGSVSLLSPEREQGRALGTTQGTASLGRILGPICGGFVFGNVGISTPYFLGTLIVLIALTIVVRLGVRIPSHALGGDSRSVEPSGLGFDKIGYFQFENLILNRVPFTLVSWGEKFENWFQGHADQHLKASLQLFPAESSVGELKKQLESLQQAKDGPVVLVSPHEDLSLRAREILVKRGFSNVFVIQGGVSGLIQDRELERG